jgi:hypothetical protein
MIAAFPYKHYYMFSKMDHHHHRVLLVPRTPKKLALDMPSWLTCAFCFVLAVLMVCHVHTVQAFTLSTNSIEVKGRTSASVPSRHHQQPYRAPLFIAAQQRLSLRPSSWTFLRASAQKSSSSSDSYDNDNDDDQDKLQQPEDDGTAGSIIVGKDDQNNSNKSKPPEPKSEPEPSVCKEEDDFMTSSSMKYISEGRSRTSAAAASPTTTAVLDYDADGGEVDEDGVALMPQPSAKQEQNQIPTPRRKKMEVAWCDSEGCRSTAIRETVSGQHNSIAFDGPATGQVTYRWETALQEDEEEGTNDIMEDKQSLKQHKEEPWTELTSVLLLVKRDDDDLMAFAAGVAKEMTVDMGLQVLLSPELAAKFKHYFGVDNERIRLYERIFDTDFGALDQSTRPAASNPDLLVQPDADDTTASIFNQLASTSAMIYGDQKRSNGNSPQPLPQTQQPIPDLVCTLGGDGLLMYASSLFPGPVPPILCIAGGSLGFLTPFSRDEMLGAIQSALGLELGAGKGDGDGAKRYAPKDPQSNGPSQFCSVFPGNLASAPADFNGEGGNSSNEYYYPPQPQKQNNGSGRENDRFYHPGGGIQICVSMRMRLDCRVINRDGIVRARYNVLNEVVIDRGSSPYLAQLECFCDDVHLTTVQADGIIFST